MKKLLRLAVLERDLAVRLLHAKSEDEAVDALIGAAVRYDPGCGVGVFVSYGGWNDIRSGGCRQAEARTLLIAPAPSRSDGLSRTVVSVWGDRGEIGRVSLIGACASPRPILERVAGMLSASLRRIAADRGNGLSDRDRELLVRELRHRTRNSLQLIKGTVSFLVGSLAHATPEMLGALDQRLSALVVLHEMLNWSDEGPRVSAAAYFTRLAEALRLLTPEGVGTVIAYYEAAEDAELSVDRAATIGLIIHELVMNTVKHGPKGVLRMSVRIARVEESLVVRYEEAIVSGALEEQERISALRFSGESGGSGLALIDGLLARARGRRLDDGGSFGVFAAAFPLE